MKRKWLILIVIIISVYIAEHLLIQHPAWAESYMCSVYPKIAATLSFLSSKVPFSLFDSFLTVLIAAFIIGLIRVFRHKTKFSSFLYLCICIGVAIFIWFYSVWGIAYFRNNFYQRNLVAEIPIEKESFDKFTSRFIKEANAAYIKYNPVNQEDADKLIEQQYQQWQDMLKINYPCGTRQTKKMLYSGIIIRMGTLGYYGPLFSETHVNQQIYARDFPMVLAHEKAHQFGIASEAECELYAFLICASSSNKELRSCAYLQTIRYLLNNYQAIFPEKYEATLQSVRPEIIQELQNRSDYYQGKRNKIIQSISSTIYDNYLKSNNINSGMENYSEVIKLLFSVYQDKRLEGFLK